MPRPARASRWTSSENGCTARCGTGRSTILRARACAADQTGYTACRETLVPWFTVMLGEQRCTRRLSDSLRVAVAVRQQSREHVVPVDLGNACTCARGAAVEGHELVDRGRCGERRVE